MVRKPPPAAPAQELVLPHVPPLDPGDPNRSEGEGLLLPSRALRMLDRVEVFTGRGTTRLHGTKAVDPAEWFFKAHFFQDPVWPGSLGLEAFLQALKAAALHLRPGLARTHRFAPLLARRHAWTYRGQVLPGNREVTLEAEIHSPADEPDVVVAGGILSVDGLPIYKMDGFGILLAPLDKREA